MKCKPGDMAIVIGGTKGTQIGRVVTCIRLLERHEHFAREQGGPVWLVDTELWWDGSRGLTQQPWAFDKWLLPINPKGESVETLDEVTA